MAFNPLRIDSNGEPSPAYRLGRPSRSIPAYKEVSDEALAILQEWHDETTEQVKAAAERKARLEELDKSEEAQQAREQMRRSIAW